MSRIFRDFTQYLEYKVQNLKDLSYFFVNFSLSGLLLIAVSTKGIKRLSKKERA